ncbi:UNKNOWN [Stylonychia lemnae]|uniref:Uncharacterized protein n=1 Tax=Stylonychia lemnae TaxID=5949 RepID=A0A078AC20_STYLE|nr:UNKNOWN [Stylonychia lemnae]|eukprot:CDW79381.1 UNKNOWN [Stylonychia lemnae]
MKINQFLDKEYQPLQTLKKKIIQSSYKILQEHLLVNNKFLTFTFQLEHISYNHGTLIEATDYQFQAIYLDEALFNNVSTSIDAKNLKIKTVSTEVKIQALLTHMNCRNMNFQYICFETDDAILDFNRVYFTNLDAEDDALFTYSFEQTVEINHRGTCINDPIVKIVMVFVNGYNYSIVQRASGGVDLYWNLRLKDSIENSITSYFDHKSNSNISFDQAVEISNDQLNFDQIHVRIVQNIVKIYSGMNMVYLKDKGQTLYLISHGKFLSIFDIEDWIWINHLQFEEEISAIYKNQVQINEYEEQDENKILEQDSDVNYVPDFQVILTNGDIHQKILDIFQQNSIVSSERCNIRLKGKILRLTDDIVKNRSIFIVIQQENQDICLKQLLHQLNGGDTVTGTIHTISSYDIENHLIMVDELNMYVYKIQEATWQIYENQYCTGLSYFDKNTSYMICQQDPSSQNPGLRMLDMEALITKDRLVVPLLKDVQIGARVNFYYDTGFNRLSCQDNTNYLCYKIIGDKFIALQANGLLQSWDMVSAKLHEKKQLVNVDYSGYEISQYDQMGAVLLQSKENISLQNSDQFFEAWQLKTTLKYQKPQCKSDNFAIKNFKLIEIKSTNEIIEYLNFDFLKYDMFQIMTVSKNKERLFTQFINYRFELIRKVMDFPSEFVINSQNYWRQYFSPNFQRQITMDKQKTKFFISDFTTGQVLFEIPQDIMDLTSDEENFKIVSEDGIEKILHIDSGFTEISYNQIPLFNEINGDEYFDEVYYLSRQTFPWSVEQLLQYTYQNYKGLYNLECKQSQEQMIPLMFITDQAYSKRSIAPFTFAHWSLIEQLQQGKLKVEELQENVVREILYNILPGGNTVLHLLCDQHEELTKLLYLAHPQGKEIKFHMPFISNLDGESPIHICLKKQAFKSIDILLNCLSLYPTDHHSRTIKDLYPNLIEQQPKNFLNYLDSRIQQTRQLEQFNKGALKEDYPEIIIDDLWLNQQDLKQQILTTGAIESRIKCEILDMPGIYHMKDQHFDSLFEQLSKTDQLDYFNRRALGLLPIADLKCNYGNIFLVK